MKIKHVEYVSGHKLKLLFSDGKTKIVDFEDWVNEDSEYLQPLRDIQYFKKVRMDKFAYSICWPNGADFCPDVLHEVGEEIVEEKTQRPRSLTGKKSRVKCRPAHALSRKKKPQ